MDFFEMAQDLSISPAMTDCKAQMRRMLFVRHLSSTLLLSSGVVSRNAPLLKMLGMLLDYHQCSAATNDRRRLKTIAQRRPRGPYGWYVT